MRTQEESTPRACPTGKMNGKHSLAQIWVSSAPLPVRLPGNQEHDPSLTLPAKTYKGILALSRGKAFP